MRTGQSKGGGTLLTIQINGCASKALSKCSSLEGGVHFNPSQLLSPCVQCASQTVNNSLKAASVHPQPLRLVPVNRAAATGQSMHMCNWQYNLYILLFIH
jgi:hypothetical protein